MALYWMPAYAGMTEKYELRKSYNVIVPQTNMLTCYRKHITVLGNTILSFFLPLAVFADNITLTNPPEDATDLLNRISQFIINPMIFTLFSAAFVVFIWGLVQFVAQLDNEESRSTGGKHMLWGIIGMVVMVGVNSIIAIIQNTIGQIGGV